MMVIDERLYNDIKAETGIDYEGNFKEEGWVSTDEPNYLVSDNSIISMLMDLVCEVENWKEKYKDLKEDMECNYKPIPIAEQIGISNNDFM